MKMANMMDIPILGVVENMSYFRCPDCGKVHRIFGEGKAKEIASDHGIKAFASLPIDPMLAAAVDAGKIEWADTGAIDSVLDVCC